MPTVTDQTVIDAIAAASYSNTASDWDVSGYASDVERLVKHMLTNRVKVVPASGELSSEAAKTLSILLNYYFGFALVSWNCDVAGSLTDYCIYAVSGAFDGYEVEEIVDPKGMLADIELGMQCAIHPDKVYSELASIGVA